MMKNKASTDAVDRSGEEGQTAKAKRTYGEVLPSLHSDHLQ